jgi:hypothetical protein
LKPLRRDAQHSAEDALRAASLLAHPDTGEFRVGTRTLGSAMGTNHQQAQDSLDRLVNAGVLKRENVSDMTDERKAELIKRGVMAVAPRNPVFHWGGKKVVSRDVFGNAKVAGTDAEEAVNDENGIESPVYTIIDKKHRATIVPFHTLSSDPIVEDKPGRQIKTPEGAKWYGSSIGSTIKATDTDPAEDAGISLEDAGIFAINKDWFFFNPIVFSNE